MAGREPRIVGSEASSPLFFSAHQTFFQQRMFSSSPSSVKVSLHSYSLAYASLSMTDIVAKRWRFSSSEVAPTVAQRLAVGGPGGRAEVSSTSTQASSAGSVPRTSH